jgi:hypothetical protein
MQFNYTININSLRKEVRMGTYADRLKRMQGAVDEQMTDYTPGGFILLAEGEYDARVTPKLTETKNDPKRLQVEWTFVVAEGEKTGKKVVDRTIIEGGEKAKVSLQICRGRIEDLGFEWPERIVNIESVVDEIAKAAPLVRIRVTHEKSTGKDGKEYENARVRITDVIGGETDTAPAATDEAPVADDTPADDVDPNLSGLLTLCNSYQLDYITDDMDIDTIVAALTDNSASFREADLNADELAIMDTVAPDLVERAEPEPEPEPEPPKRTMAKPTAKPASKSTAKTAAKPAQARGRR